MLVGYARTSTAEQEGNRPVAPSLGRTGAKGRNNPRELSPTSQRHVRAVAILGPRSRLEGSMRAYLTVIRMALGLVAVWAALVPFVA
jgi:hypothetical protein